MRSHRGWFVYIGQCNTTISIYTFGSENHRMREKKLMCQGKIGTKGFWVSKRTRQRPDKTRKKKDKTGTETTEFLFLF